MTKRQSLRQKILTCERCPELAAHRNKVVVGDSCKNATYVIIGEAPGGVEDETGTPFVGRSGQRLRRELTTHGIFPRKNAAIINTLKCRPPNNRNPTKEELYNCKEYAVKQIEVLKPKVMLACGRYAHSFVLDLPPSKVKVLQNVGNVCCYDDGSTPIPCVLTYHPSFLLRMRNKEIQDAFARHIEKFKQLGVAEK